MFLYINGICQRWHGYVPSARVLREGDYEAEICPNFSGTWAADIEMKIISGVMELAGQAGK